MSENRRQILEMLAQGKITAAEAERLLAALEKEPQGASTTGSAEPRRTEKLKYMRVVVDSVDSHGPTKVNIRIPMQLLRAGVRLTSLIPPQAREQVNDAMHKQGIDFDIGKLTPANLEELLEQLNDFHVDVDNDRAKVRIFCE
jgi:hypothetical protein